MTAAELLVMAMLLHNRAKPVGKGKRPDGWKDLLREAARLRSEAFKLDPGYDPKHEHFMAFYRDMGVA